MPHLTLTPSAPRRGAEAIARGLARVGLVEAVAALLVAATLLLIFVGLDPLPDLGDKGLLELTFSGDALVNALFIALTAGSVACLLSMDPRGLLAHLRLPVLLLMGWLALSVVVSPDVGASARRLVLSLMTLTLAALAPILAGSLRRLAILLAIGVGVALLISWAGVILVPERAIHQWTDVGETDLAGSWRGLYAHKNGAGAVMVVFVFAGLFIARAASRTLGIAIAVAAAIFLPFTLAKSATGLCVVVLVLGWLLPRIPGLGTKALVAFAPFVALNALSVGTVVSPTLAGLASLLPIDTTYTGRTAIWQMAIDNIALKPVTGHGFQAFWGSAAVLFGSEDAFSWAETASTSHNSHVELALSTGLPGLALAFLVLAVLPLRDLHRSVAAGSAQEAFRLFCLRVWLFALYLASYEAFFFNRSDPMWFSLALAVCGLRYASAFRLKS